MKKRELAQIPIDKFKVEDLVGFNELEHNHIPYYISSKIVTINKSKILVLAFFRKKDVNFELRYRVFLDKKNNKYITQEFSESTFKWRSGSISNSFGMYYDWHKRCIIINKKSTDNILKYFKAHENPLLIIDTFQQNILNKKALIRNKKETDIIDKKMKEVPPIPKGFGKWVDEVALIGSRYIYYQYINTSKPISGFCTHCKQEVSVVKHKHNTQGICPNCKSKITYKSEGKSQHVQDKAYCTLIQKVSTGFIIRYFTVYKYYTSHYKEPKLLIYEYIRSFYDKNFNFTEEFEWRRFKGRELRWCKDIHTGFMGRSYDYTNISLYTKNLSSVLKNSPLQYSQLREFATHKKGFKFPVYSYIYDFKQYPFIEYLVKLKLFNMVNAILTNSSLCGYSFKVSNYFNLQGKNLKEILQLNKNYVPVLQRLSAGITILKILQNCYKMNLSITDDQTLFISANFPNYLPEFFSLLKRTSIYLAIKYIKSQLNSGKSTSNILRDWVDYIENCEKLGYDLSNNFVLFPKNLKQSHDDAMKLIKEKNLEEKNQLIKARFAELKKIYNWQYKDYFIIPAKDAHSMIAEGHALHHCVGTNYLSSMAKGDCDILFLRKISEPNKSFYTIEISNNNVRQCRGQNNCDMSPEIEKIIEIFKKQKLRNDLVKAV